MSGRVPELSAVQGRLSITLAVLYCKEGSGLFLFECSCSGAVVEVLLIHELVPGGREEEGIIRVLSESSMLGQDTGFISQALPFTPVLRIWDCLHLHSFRSH